MCAACPSRKRCSTTKRFGRTRYRRSNPDVFVALLAAVLLVPAAGTLKVEKSTDAMGATFSVVLYGSDLESMNQAADAALQEAHRLDELLSNYKPASEWSRINRDAGSQAVVV